MNYLLREEVLKYIGCVFATNACTRLYKVKRRQKLLCIINDVGSILFSSRQYLLYNTLSWRPTSLLSFAVCFQLSC